MSYWVNEPPMLMLCDPFSQFIVSSISSARRVARLRRRRRRWQLVRAVPSTRREVHLEALWLASEPLNMPTFISSKNVTGAPL